MDTGRRGVLAWEDLWIRRVGVAALVGSLLALLGFVLLQSSIGGDANFEGLREAHDSSTQISLSGLATGIGYILLAAPLFFLFKAVQQRSPRVRNQLIGLAILGPLLLGVSGALLAAGTQQAANTYLDGNPTLTSQEVKETAKECNEERKENGAKQFAEDFESSAGAKATQACLAKKGEEAKASNAITDSGLITLGQFTGLAGGLTLVIALFYTGLWSMRTGLLSRFWGSLGMAVGVAALIGLTPLALLWFFYLGLLLVGILPGGRPPAWAAGEAIPWPTPGQKIAADLDPGEDEPLGPDQPEADGPPDAPRDPPRKRKQRD
jgi:hypothetical protein